MRKNIAWIFLASVIFLASRLYQLTILPIFLDESLHIGWALEMIDTGSWLVGDGARLLPLWILRLLLPLTTDILWAGRLTAGLISLLAAWGCYLAGQSLFNRRVGAIAFVLYTLNPFTLHNDRLLVMTDMMLVIWVTLSVWLSLKMIKTQPTWRYTLALGVVLGLVILTNLRGILIWGLPVLAAALLAPQRWRQWLKYLPLAYMAALVVAAPVWWILRTGLTASQGVSLVGNPLSTWVRYWGYNTALLAAWLWAYLTPGLLAALAVAIIFILRRQPRPGLFLAAWALSFMVPYILVAEQWQSRYTLPAYPAIFILCGWLLSVVGEWLTSPAGRQQWLRLSVGAVGVMVLTGPLLYFDYWQLRDPVQAPYPATDRAQYIEDWSAGYGLAEVIDTLHTQAQAKGKIFVVMDAKVYKQMGQLVFAGWRGQEQLLHLLNAKTLAATNISQQVAQSSLPVYWVTGDENSPQTLNQEKLAAIHVEPIATVTRPGGKTHLYVYFLSPQK